MRWSTTTNSQRMKMKAKTEILTALVLTTFFVLSFLNGWCLGIYLIMQESDGAPPVARRRIGGPHKGRGGGAAGANDNEECKQQWSLERAKGHRGPRFYPRFSFVDRGFIWCESAYFWHAYNFRLSTIFCLPQPPSDSRLTFYHFPKLLENLNIFHRVAPSEKAPNVPYITFDVFLLQNAYVRWTCWIWLTSNEPIEQCFSLFNRFISAKGTCGSPSLHLSDSINAVRNVVHCQRGRATATN